ncbi:group I truncated hemoglobin [Shewanella khirikhana]|uniref:group I truncated hemoglobin n=1 Tax=Shewanella khirikhana TaxID=1965282 RepID=UPI001F29DCE4|nr:group 1 truncated hemoglobin [Shewanella khirikhana]
MGVVQIVDGLLERIARDPRIVHHFDETDIAIFRERLIEHLCAVTDGGCVYQGENMADSHRGLNITQADFDALVGHLIESMKDADVPTSTRNALLKRLAPMYGDVTYQ